MTAPEQERQPTALDATTAGASHFRLPPPVPDHDLLRLIGRGSYGEVWLARNIMGTLRAVKVVYRGVFEQDRPFEREFAGLQRYEPVSRSHEGLVNILHIGRHEPSQCFYSVMELADDANGVIQPEQYRPKTLRFEINRQGRLPLEQCLSLAFSLAAALGHLHKHHLVHRDLKPSNIIFVQGRPKIADIGLIAESGDARSVVGTEGFFPPRGLGTPQADLFALGRVLYEASTGLDRLQFPKLPVDWLSNPQHNALMEFNEVLVRACETDPARGYQSAEEMLADLALLQVGKSVRRIRGLERRLQAARRFGLAALGVALAALTGYGLAQRAARRERDARERVVAAEVETRRQLAEARLAQARAMRLTGRAGQRFECLDVIATATRAQPSIKLRNEAIGALALTDLRFIRQLPSRGASQSEPVVDFQTQRYVCGDAQGNLSIRRVTDDAELLSLPGQGQRIHGSPGFSRDGVFLAMRPTSDTLIVWNLSSREKVVDVPAQGSSIFAQFLPNSRGIVWCAGRKPLKRVDLIAGTASGEWPVPHPVFRFACAPDGRHLALAYEPTNLVEVLSLDHGTVVARVLQPSPVQSLQWHSSQALLATSHHDNRVRVWDPLTGQLRLVLEGHEDVSGSLDFHPTAPLLASSAWDGTTRLWDLRTGKQAVVMQEAGDNLQFSADGRWLTVNEYNDAHALLCEVAAEPVCQILSGPPVSFDQSFRAVAFYPAGRLLARADTAGVQFFDLERHTQLPGVTAPCIHCVQFATDGASLVAGSDEGPVRWPVTWHPDGGLQMGAIERVGNSRGPCYSICHSGDALAWTRGNSVQVQRAGREVIRLQASGSLAGLASSPNGRWLAAAETGRDARVHLWETTAWERIRTMSVQTGARLAFSPDNTFLICGTPEEYLFWDLANGQVRHRLPRHHTATMRGPLAFSPDGRTLAVCRTRTLIALYSYPDLKELAAFEAPQPVAINGLAFDPSGNQLVADITQAETQLWDLRAMRRQLAALGLAW